MNLFQKSILKKHLRRIRPGAIEKAWELFASHFLDPQIQENIQNSKEEQYQEGFLDDLFVKVFGYTKNPKPDFDLTTELKNPNDGKKADGALLKDGKALAVIELKSTGVINLKNIEPQAFGYKNSRPGCEYVITSNFEKLRFYINNTVDYQEFNLFKLSFEDFKVLWLCLAKENLFAGLPKRIKEESVEEERIITDKFYNEYSGFRNQIFEDLIRENPEYDKLTLFKKTQKLLDRFLFTVFAEKRGLLPNASVKNVLKEWTALRTDYDEYFPLYDRFKKFFGYVNTGHIGPKHDIFGYNGGLFAEDEILNKVKIGDTVLFNYSMALGEYDYESDISVNILGHIFEHSLNEIEEIQYELRGESWDKKKTKRKKDGVFYTPEYITAYMIEHTIGKLCEEKKAEIDLSEQDFGQKMKAGPAAKALTQKLETYRDWLLSVTVCDPACGSGAFLNQALEFFLAEHRFISELESKLPKPLSAIENLENQVLESNLFGVDLNEESVDIAKLSLWLRTAEYGRKLSFLSDNLKCGNSLIDDPETAGEKAFDWPKEFPQVFKNQGFDVVIGNPPYGAKMSKENIAFLVNAFSDSGFTNRLSDSYIAFFINSLKNQLKPEGLLSFISPNTWRLIEGASDFRDFVLSSDYQLYKITQHTEKVFREATVDVDSVFLKKKSSASEIVFTEVSVGDIREKKILSHFFPYAEWKMQKSINLFLTEKTTRLRTKIKDFSFCTGDYFDIKNGIKLYEKGKGNPPQTAAILAQKPFTSSNRTDASFSPLIGGKSFHKNQLLWEQNYWIKYGEWLAAPRDLSIFEREEKLIFRQTSDKIIGTLIPGGFFMRNNTHIVLSTDSSPISLKCLLAILNSRLLNFYYWTINPEKGEALAEVKAFHLALLPFPRRINNENDFIEKETFLLEKNELLVQTIQQFSALVKAKFKIEKRSRKLQHWHKQNPSVFLEELSKTGVKLSLEDEAAWLKYFKTEKQKTEALQIEIEQTEQEIDRMVYELYALSPEEIALVEAGIG